MPFLRYYLRQSLAFISKQEETNTTKEQLRSAYDLLKASMAVEFRLFCHQLQIFS